LHQSKFLDKNSTYTDTAYNHQIITGCTSDTNKTPF